MTADGGGRKAYYLGQFRENRRAILDCGALGFDPSIPGCPGWDVAALIGHMARVYTFWLKWVTERPRGFSREAFAEIVAGREARLPGFSAWMDAGFPKASRPSGLMEVAEQSGDELDAALTVLQPDEEVWTFVPGRQNGAFVFRRICMETTVHRVDAEEAHGIFRPIESELARDGIDEMLMMYREDPGYAEQSAGNRTGQTVLLRESSGPGRWLVTFNGEMISVSEVEGPADVTVSGSASDLMLFTQGRRAARDLQVDGDRTIAEAWADLAGRF